MYVILFKLSTQLQMEQYVIGPFASYAEAYDALCELPAPGDGGHKYIQEMTPNAAMPEMIAMHKASV